MHVDTNEYMKKTHKFNLPHLSTAKKPDELDIKTTALKEKSKSSPPMRKFIEIAFIVIKCANGNIYYRIRKEIYG